MRPSYPWIIAGPWYRWDDPGVPASGRQSRPLFQKYASADFVNEFLEEPQRSLQFLDEDFVHKVYPNGTSKYSLANTTYTKTNLRKIFLTTHSRFYLVVCELHCDAAGFPSVSREAVCDAGFVVRRRLIKAAPAVRRQLWSVLHAIQKVEAKIKYFEADNLKPQKQKNPWHSAVKSELYQTLTGSLDQKVAKLQKEHLHQQMTLQDLIAQHKISSVLQGWIPARIAESGSWKIKGIGSWTEVQEEPQEVWEEIYPLYPLIPNPAEKQHSAQGRSIWFGVLPTGSSYLDDTGNPCFDDRNIYEIRCFLRRHKETCPQKSTFPCCPGKLIWSKPTERYQLASHFDLVGTSNRPINIQMPDLEALKAQTEGLPMGEGMGVRMVTPPDSSLQFDMDRDNPSKPKNTGIGGASICCFAIPLITIVATFVLRLFLPIVVFIFQLWFLLRLRFCIPPSLSIDADLAATLNADLSAGADIGTDIQARLNAGESITIDGKAINNMTDFRAVVKDTLNQVDQDLSSGLGEDINVMGKLTFDLSTDFSASAPADFADYLEASKGFQADLPSAIGKFEYYELVKVPDK